MMAYDDKKLTWSCTIEADGRIYLSESLRLAASLQCGDELVMIIENGSIVIRTFEEAIQKLQDEFCEGIPEDVSLVDELIAERRAEADREDGY